MARSNAGRATQAGFSLQEVLVVVAIGLIITAAALPSMSTAIANMKLRSSMTSVSGLLQNTRTMAVKENKTKTACHFNRTIPPYSLVYFVRDATDCTAVTVTTADVQVEMEAPITPYPSPTGTGAPSAITNGQMGLTTVTPLTSDPSFNSRGLPCTYSAGTCTPNTAFVQYYKDNRIGGSGGWAAVSISPAGRIKRWFWNGASWIE
jgi:prepilin-type N-terminal cleavage/methylation domain-containing protein